jgi:hypothetical protein
MILNIGVKFVVDFRDLNTLYFQLGSNQQRHVDGKHFGIAHGLYMVVRIIVRDGYI